MSETQDLTTTDESDQEESSVIKAAREREKADKAKIKQLEQALEEVQKRESAAREADAQAVVDTLGFPGLKDDVLGWVEGAITEESVVAALEARGLMKPDPEAAKPEGSKDESRPASELGQRVADAASGGAEKDLQTRIMGAKSQDEIKAIMAEAKLTRSYTD